MYRNGLIKASQTQSNEWCKENLLQRPSLVSFLLPRDRQMHCGRFQLKECSYHDFWLSVGFLTTIPTLRLLLFNPCSCCRVARSSLLTVTRHIRGWQWYTRPILGRWRYIRRHPSKHIRYFWGSCCWRLRTWFHIPWSPFCKHTIIDYTPITAYLLLRVHCDKIMHACWDFDASNA